MLDLCQLPLREPQQDSVRPQELEVSKALAERLVLLLGYSYLMFPPGKSELQTGVPRRPLGSAHRQVEVGRVVGGKAVA